MTPDYPNMSVENLVDLLAQKTVKFTQMFIERRFDDEYHECKNDIHHLQSEIEQRRKNLNINGHSYQHNGKL